MARVVIVLWDSIYVSEVASLASTSGQAVAGYVSGSWPDYAAMAAAFPHDLHLSIASTAGHDADILDIETGDATPAQAPAWYARQKARGAWRPGFYASLSVMPQVRAYLRNIPRADYRLWVADWTYQPHIPAGYDACQWTDHAAGHNLDESLCLDTFFQQAPTPAPTPHPAPQPPEGTVAITAAQNQDGRLEIFVELQSGEVKHIAQDQPNGDWWKDQNGQHTWLSLGNPGQ